MVKQSTSKTSKNEPSTRKSPTANIGNIGSLKRFPDRDYALDIIHNLAKLVAPIMHEKGFKITTLCEMYPKNRNLLGLNVNKGQKVLLRLRLPTNDRLFLPMNELIGTLLHELTHNLYGPHDKTFFDYMDSLKKRFEEIQYGGATVGGGYICEELQLGRGQGVLLNSGYQSIRQKRLNAVTKVQFKSGTHRLGTIRKDKGGNLNKLTNMTMRELILLAAERRHQEDKTCGETHKDVVMVEDDELMTYDSIGKEKERRNGTDVEKKDRNVETTLEKLKEVVDLTGEEYDEPNIEIIEINECSRELKSTSRDPKSILRRKKDDDDERQRLVSFELLPSFEEGGRGFHHGDDIGLSKLVPDFGPMIGEIQYVTSTSPRTFMEENTEYPRRKMVADLNFNQIMEFQKDDLFEEASFLEINGVGMFDVKAAEKLVLDNIVSIPIETVSGMKRKLKLTQKGRFDSIGKEEVKGWGSRTGKNSKGRRGHKRKELKSETRTDPRTDTRTDTRTETRTDTRTDTETERRTKIKSERKTVKSILFTDLL